MTRETDIMHQNGNFWVRKEVFKGRAIYRVFEISTSGTHSVARDTFDLAVNGLLRAVAKCDQRAAGPQKWTPETARQHVGGTLIVAVEAKRDHLVAYP